MEIPREPQFPGPAKVEPAKPFNLDAALGRTPFAPNRADAVQVDGSHYKDMPMQPWTVMESVLTRDEFIGFLKGNIIKYAMRAGQKAGATKDGEKARHYKQKLDEVLNG